MTSDATGWVPARPPDRPRETRHVVTAVLVAHDGARWLPQVLDALEASGRRPDHVVAADTGSRDATAELLARRLGAGRVLTLERRTGFGAAVGQAVALADAHRRRADAGPNGSAVVEWLWLLHDDCAPAPDALARLLRVAQDRPEAAVLGPKVRGWYDRRLLLEVGVTVTGGGRRETSLERREQDQGQYDGVREVLAVGSAGMLVRRDVWDELGGFDPAITMFRDDVDLCWRAALTGRPALCVTDAVVHHAEATARGRRRLDAGTVRSPHLADRRSALYMVLANSPAVSLPLLLVRLVLGTVVRAVAHLLVKLARDAFDEVAALCSVLARPDRVVSGRRRRRAHRRMPHRAVRHLLAPPTAQLRHVGEALSGVLAGRTPTVDGTPVDQTGAARHRDGVDPPLVVGPPRVGALERLRRLLRRPGVLLAVLLGIAALVAGRRLLGAGRLAGGALLPLAGAGELWADYTGGWHPVGLGSSTEAPAFLAVLAGAVALSARSAELTVRLLLLGALPLAGVSAYLCTGSLTRGRLPRIWAGVTWATLPVLTGAVAAGRLGAVVAVVLLPPLARATVRSTRSWRAAAGASLLLAGSTASSPPVGLAAAAAALVLVAALPRGSGLDRRLRPMAAVGGAVLLLAPWSLSVARHPWLLLDEPGLAGPGPAQERLDPAAAVLLHPGGPGGYPVVVSVGLLLAALAALLRPERRRVVAAGWVVALSGMTAAVLLSRARVPGDAFTQPAPAWPGPATAVAALGLLVAAVAGAEGVTGRLSDASFGWRQPLAVSVAALAVGTPVLALVWWATSGTGESLVRRDARVLPPAVAAAQRDDGLRTRVLVLSGTSAHVRYALLRSDLLTLTDVALAPTARSRQPLGGAVADLVSGRDSEVAERLTTFAVRHVVVADRDRSIVRALDRTVGMTRVGGRRGAAAWQVDGTPARLRVLDASGAVRQALRSGRTGARATVAAGAAPRRLVLAELTDPRWRATLDGRPLVPVTVDGWAQGFILPGDGGRVVLARAGHRWRWMLLEGAVLLVLLGTALPGASRRDGWNDPSGEPPPVPRRQARRRRRRPEPVPAGHA